MPMGIITKFSITAFPLTDAISLIISNPAPTLSARKKIREKMNQL